MGSWVRPFCALFSIFIHRSAQHMQSNGSPQAALCYAAACAWRCCTPHVHISLEYSITFVWLTKLYKCCGLLAYETIAHGWAHWVGTVQCSTHSIVFSQSATRAYSTSYIHTYYRMDRHGPAWGSHVHFHYVICTALRAVMQCITRKQYIRALYSAVR